MPFYPTVVENLVICQELTLEGNILYRWMDLFCLCDLVLQPAHCVCQICENWQFLVLWELEEDLCLWMWKGKSVNGAEFELFHISVTKRWTGEHLSIFDIIQFELISDFVLKVENIKVCLFLFPNPNNVKSTQHKLFYSICQRKNLTLIFCVCYIRKTTTTTALLNKYSISGPPWRSMKNTSKNCRRVLVVLRKRLIEYDIKHYAQQWKSTLTKLWSSLLLLKNSMIRPPVEYTWKAKQINGFAPQYECVKVAYYPIRYSIYFLKGSWRMLLNNMRYDSECCWEKCQQSTLCRWFRWLFWRLFRSYFT